MKKKLVVIFSLLLLLILLIPAFAQSPPNPVTNLKSTLVEDWTVKLQWNPSPGANGYAIYRKSEIDDWRFLYQVKESQYIDKDTDFPQYYFYRVHPYKEIAGKKIYGRSTTYSYVFSYSMLPPVEDLKAERQGNQVKLDWDYFDYYDGFFIYQQGPDGVMNHVATTQNYEYRANVSEPGYYFYRVVPYRKYKSFKGMNAIVPGKSDKYVYAHVPKIFPSPSKVKNLTASTTVHGYVKLTWDADPGASHYYIYRKHVGTDRLVYHTMVTNTTFTDLEVPAGFVFYRVVATNVAESGAPSDYVYTRPDLYVPTENYYVYHSLRGPVAFTIQTDKFQEDFLSLVNAERSKLGVAPLTYDPKLQDAANFRAVETALLFSHTRPNGQSYSTATADAVGENILMGAGSSPFAYQIWYSSAGHKKNMLRPSYTRTALGVIFAKGRFYWCQIFGS